MKVQYVFVALACSMIAHEANTEERRPLSDVMPLLRAQMTAQCTSGRERLSGVTDALAKDQAGSMVKIACDCMPPEIDRATDDLQNNGYGGLITQEEFLTRMHLALTRCTARTLRDEIGTRCETESAEKLGVVDKKSYCGCVSTRVGALDDQTLAAATTAARQHWEAKARARLNNEPSPPAPPRSAVDEIREDCKKMP